MKEGINIPAVLWDPKTGIFDNMEKKTQHFALPYFTSKGHQLVEQYTSEPNIMNIGNVLTTVFYEEFCPAVPMLQGLETQKQQEGKPIPDERVTELIKVFKEKCPEIARFHAYNKTKGSFINFTRRSPSHCDICDKKHDKDNTLYYSLKMILVKFY